MYDVTPPPAPVTLTLVLSDQGRGDWAARRTALADHRQFLDILLAGRVEEEGFDGCGLDGFRAPGDGDSPAFQPERQKVRVVRRKRVAGLAAGQREEGCVPVSDVKDHAQGWDSARGGQRVFPDRAGLRNGVDVTGAFERAEVEDTTQQRRTAKGMGQRYLARPAPLPTVRRLAEATNGGGVRPAKSVVDLRPPTVREPALGALA